MGYIGNQTSNSYSSFDKQDLTGVTGSPAKRGFTLSHAVANAQEIEVFVNNVRQEPGEAYTVSGTGLTMTGDVETTDDFYVVFQGKALQTTVPPDGSVTTAKINDGAVTSAKLDTNIDIAGTLDVTGVITPDAGFGNSASANFTSGSTLIQPTTNGIPSWANEIKISFYDVSQAGTSDVLFRAYVGGSVVTTNYQYTSIFIQNTGSITIADRSAGGDGGFAFYGWSNAGSSFNGTVTFTKVTDDYKYVAFGNFYNHGFPTYANNCFNGRVDLAGAISGVDLSTSTNFDGGSVRVTWT